MSASEAAEIHIFTRGVIKLRRRRGVGERGCLPNNALSPGAQSSVVLKRKKNKNKNKTKKLFQSFFGFGEKAKHHLNTGTRSSREAKEGNMGSLGVLGTTEVISSSAIPIFFMPLYFLEGRQKRCWKGNKAPHLFLYYFFFSPLLARHYPAARR